MMLYSERVRRSYHFPQKKLDFPSMRGDEAIVFNFFWKALLFSSSIYFECGLKPYNHRPCASDDGIAWESLEDRDVEVQYV